MWNMCLFFRQGKVRKPNNRYKHQKQHIHRAWSRKSGDRKWACSFQVYSLREHLQIKFYPSLILDYSVFFYCSFRPLLLWLVFIPRFATFVNSTQCFVKCLNPEVISKVGWVWSSGWTLSWIGLLLLTVTDVSTTAAVVIFRVKMFSLQDWLLRPLPFPATSFQVPHPSACSLPIHMKLVKNTCESSNSPELLCNVKTNILTTLDNVLSALKWHKKTCKRVSMGLTDRRKTAKNLVDSRKNWQILTVSRK